MVCLMFFQKLVKMFEENQNLIIFPDVGFLILRGGFNVISMKHFMAEDHSFSSYAKFSEKLTFLTP